jgi:hypothetical protein
LSAWCQESRLSAWSEFQCDWKRWKQNKKKKLVFLKMKENCFFLNELFNAILFFSCILVTLKLRPSLVLSKPTSLSA